MSTPDPTTPGPRHLVRVVDDERPLPEAERGLLVRAEIATPTQVANPKRTLARSLLQLALALVLTLPQIVPIILGAWDPAWLVTALGQVLVVHGVLVRIMSIPGINQWLVDHAPWLAAIPSRLERL